MTGEYLRLSPFVFIHREVSALRRLGFHIETVTIRGLADAGESVNDAQREEAARIFVVLPPTPARLLGAHARLLGRDPGRWFGALRLAWQTRPPGLPALLRQLAYFAEAGIVAEHMRERGLVHLHNHFASSSGTVAMLAAELGGFTFSLSEHGPDIFWAPDWWRLDAKFSRALFVACLRRVLRSPAVILDPGAAIFWAPDWWRLDAKFSRALFVACISRFCRSQVLIWTPVERWGRVPIVHCGVDPTEYAVRAHRDTRARR